MARKLSTGPYYADMLTSLTVRNLALVDRVDIEFGSGLNVITGETGAGKSILIGALGLVLGERADKSMIRTGESQCSAQAVFHLADSAVINALLEENGLDPCDEGQLVLRRMVKATGGSQNFVNDCAVTLHMMKRLGRLLVDIHGPHDHQSLFDADFQLDLLDAFGRHSKARTAYGQAYGELRSLERRCAELEDPQEGVAEQIDLLTYRVHELETAALAAEEEEGLLREHQTLGNAQEIRRLGQAVCQGLVEADGSMFDILADVQRSLEELSRLMPEAERWRDEARSVAIQIQELHRSLSSEMESIEGDPGRLEWLDQRLAVYQLMKRKYGPSIETCLETLTASRERLNDLSSRGERLAEVKKKIEAADAHVRKCGAILSAKRKTAAKILTGRVTREIQKLGFEKGAFAVSVREGGVRPSGLDEAEFGFAPNVGETMRSLRSIASSGEISRVMLATKGVLANVDRIPVLVFDEIDANVGGKTGMVVGQALSELGESRQILCITHLPHVAAFGTSHFAVAKSVTEGRTITEVHELHGDERVEEVARMLGGKDLTKVTMQHAREMIEQH